MFSCREDMKEMLMTSCSDVLFVCLAVVMVARMKAQIHTQIFTHKK